MSKPNPPQSPQPPQLILAVTPQPAATTLEVAVAALRFRRGRKRQIDLRYGYLSG